VQVWVTEKQSSQRTPSLPFPLLPSTVEVESCTEIGCPLNWSRCEPGGRRFFFLLHWKIWVFMRHLTYRSWTISEWGTVFQSLGSFHRFSFYIFFSLHTLTCRFTVVSICFSSWCRCTVNVCMVSCCQLVRLFRGYSSIDIPGIAHFFQWTLLELQLMVRHDINCWNQCCQVHDDQD
jgi:hypothetical protein